MKLLDIQSMKKVSNIADFTKKDYQSSYSYFFYTTLAVLIILCVCCGGRDMQMHAVTCIVRIAPSADF